MKIKRKKCSAIVLVLGLLLSVRLAAYAHDVPDLARLCSITVTPGGEGSAAGGSLTLYRVGEAAEEDGNYFFQPTGDFSSCGESFRELENEEAVASALSDYAQKKDIAGLSTKEIGPEGSVTFEELSTGLYLLVQREAAPGYERLAPFLVSLPYLEAGEYKYDLSALPKLEPEGKPVPEPPPTEPEASLPQTGQLLWPVPVLAAAGMALFAVGWVLCEKKRGEHEA